MNRTQVIQEVAQKAGLPHESARRVVEALFGGADGGGLIAAALKRRERVQLAGFGTFEARGRRERRGLNPQTRLEIVIPASVAPVFRAGSALKTHVR